MLRWLKPAPGGSRIWKSGYHCGSACSQYCRSQSLVWQGVDCWVYDRVDSEYDVVDATYVFGNNVVTSLRRPRHYGWLWQPSTFMQYTEYGMTGGNPAAWNGDVERRPSSYVNVDAQQYF